MQKVRALAARSVGEPAEVLNIVNRELPAPGAGEVLIRVAAAPIHASDLHIMRGRYGFTPEFPTVLGLELVGIVDDIGPDVRGLARGDRVITVGVTGTWQDLVVADQQQVLKVPDSFDTSTACQLIANPLTAWLLVTEQLAVQPGEWLLQTAAGSTVGKIVLQLSCHLGYHTVNVVRRRAAVAEIQALGGTEVICTEDEEIMDRLADMNLAGAQPITKAIDCVAGQLGADVARALAPGGQMVVYGALATHRQTDPAALTIPLFARSMIYETKSVRGFWLYRWFAATPAAQIRRVISDLILMVDQGIITIPRGQPFRFSDFADAVRLAEAPGHGGKPFLIFTDQAQ